MNDRPERPQMTERELLVEILKAVSAIKMLMQVVVGASVLAVALTLLSEGS